MVFSLIGFALLYSLFIAAELYLMFKFARLGPTPHDATHPTSEPTLTPRHAFGEPGYAAKSWK
jgi:cytochrome d ubiquinol oxidase subunit I